MFSISTKEGEPIGLYKSHNGNKLLYIKQNDVNGGCAECDGSCGGCLMCKEITANLIEDYIKNTGARINFRQIQKLKNALEKGEEPEDDLINKLYKIAKSEITEQRKKEILFKDGIITPLVNSNSERQVFYITGMSGSGKSSYINEILPSYINAYKGKRKILLFSNKEQDPSYKNEKIIRIKLDEDLLTEPLTLEELKNKFIIFDDIEGVPNKKIMQEMDRLRDLILQQGRQYNITFAYVSHLANNYKQTRTILNECHSITIFPYMTTAYSLKYLLERYFGLDKEAIKKINSLNSRWITLIKCPTLTVLHQHGAYLIN